MEDRARYDMGEHTGEGRKELHRIESSHMCDYIMGLGPCRRTWG